jgi:hypothetical protein
LMFSCPPDDSSGRGSSEFNVSARRQIFASYRLAPFSAQRRRLAAW